MIKNVVFDFGGVVIDWNPHYAYDPYFGDRAKSDWFLANICTWAWNNCQDAGRPFAEAVASLSAEYPEWSAEIALFRERWEEMVGGLVPGTSEIIARLKKA